MVERETIRKLRVAIIGTGAMGGLFAGLLSPFADVVMIGNWVEQLQEISERGLIVQQLDGDKSSYRFAATDRASDASPSDIALILVKGWQTAAAAAAAQAALVPAGLAITLQNGLGNFEVLAKRINSGRVVQGVTSEGATLLGPGMVRHAGHGHTYLAANETTRGRLEETSAMFRQAGFATTVVDDAQSLIWGKLAVNAGINPLTALLQVPNGRLLGDQRIVDIMLQAVQEVEAVAKKLGVTMPFDDVSAQTMAVARATAKNRSSMAQDVARGMPTEIEQITGAVVRYGSALDVPTPVNGALLHLVRAQVARGAWQSAIQDLPPELQRVFRELSKLEIQ